MIDLEAVHRQQKRLIRIGLDKIANDVGWR